MGQWWERGWPQAMQICLWLAWKRSYWQLAPGQLTPAFYKHFIDDVFGIWCHGEEALCHFLQFTNAKHPDIRFTYTYGSSADFMDVTVKVENSSIVTDLFMKATDTDQFFLPTSNHPPHVRRTLPQSLALRLRVIVSKDAAFKRRLRDLRGAAKGRGYLNRTIDEQLQFDRVRCLPRVAALQRREQVREVQRTPLVTTWDPQLPNFSGLLKQAQPILRFDIRLSEVYAQPLVALQRPPNLRSLVVCTKPSRGPAVIQPHPSFFRLNTAYRW